MAIYLAVSLAPNIAPFDNAVQSTITASNRYRLQANRGWIIQYDGTSRELSDEIGVTGQAKGEPAPLGSAMFVVIGGYYGRGPTEMWEWLKTRMEK